MLSHILQWFTLTRIALAVAVACWARMHWLFHKGRLTPALARPYGRAMLRLVVLARHLQHACGAYKQPWTWVEPDVALACLPLPVHVPAMAAQGVRAVVNTVDGFAGPRREYAAHGIQQLCLPTIDHVEPSLDDLHAAMQWIHEHTQRGHKVFVHCAGAHGRSAAVVFAWLVHARGLSLPSAQQTLNERAHVRKGLYQQPNLVAFAAARAPNASAGARLGAPLDTHQA